MKRNFDFKFMADIVLQKIFKFYVYHVHVYAADSSI